MKDSISILAEHVANTLPDSIIKRKQVLVALSRVLKANHKAYRPVMDQLRELEAIETLQAQLPLAFLEQSNPPAKKPYFDPPDHNGGNQ